MNITRGKVSKAQKVVIYGPEGIGKSSLSAKFPDPLFNDIEGSTGNMDVARLDRPTSWTMLLQQCEWVKQTRPCGSLVLDTVDWAERMAIEYICFVNSKTSIEDFGYGAGYIKLEEELGRFLNLLQDIVDVGINVVLTAHAQVRKFEQPDEMGAYDRYELKLGKKTSSRTSALVKEWADMVLFCNYKVLSVATDDKGKKFKGQGGQRMMYTTHHPAWDAKNRFGLPEELPLDYSHIAHIFSSSGAPVQAPVQQMQTQIPTAHQPVDPVAPPMEVLAQTPPNMQMPPTVEPVFPQQPPVVEQPMQQSITPPIQTQQPQQEPDFQTDIKVEETDYTGIPAALADLMKPENVTPVEIQKVVASKGYYPVNTPIENYDPNFINGVLVAAWHQVLPAIIQDREMPF